LLPSAASSPPLIKGDHVKETTARRGEGAVPADRPGVGTPAGRDRTSRRRAENASDQNELVEWVKSGLIAVALFFIIRTFLVQAYTIPSGSMEQTLLVGDYLMANNAIFGAQIPFTRLSVPAFREPQHGDIVVFRPAYNIPVIDVVKRVIGEPGDTIAMVDRVVYRNGQQLAEPYADPDYLPDERMHRYGGAGFDWHFAALTPDIDPASYHPTRDNWGPLVVPPGQFLLLGDNRDESLDSRYMGFIPREVIRGKAMFVYYSIDHGRDRPFPQFITSARWNRIGTVLR
jgi:signal peptidase I